MSVKIPNLAIGGYRSFGSVQYFDKFSKINLFIGRNNCGKSNVLRFLKEVYTRNDLYTKTISDPLAKHLNGTQPLLIAVAEKVPRLVDGSVNFDPDFRLFASLQEHERERVGSILAHIYNAKLLKDDNPLCWTLLAIPRLAFITESWSSVFNDTSDADLKYLWSSMTRQTGGDRKAHWEPEVLRLLPASFTPREVHLIPAIRKIEVTSYQATEMDFSGEGIIDKLAQLQNPDVHQQELRNQFEQITKFVQTVLDRDDAVIEIPYTRDTIQVHMDGRVLPLESLGTGVHEVIILAAAATILNETVLCIEEPELHLNPILQRKLMHYLAKQTTNQYFITTHAPALMDTPNAEIYHIVQESGESHVLRVTSDNQRSQVCEDLGYHPSDLLQANCIIWVEGPSDRIYVNYWLSALDHDFIEGVHYSIMFYGGRLLSHLSFSDDHVEAVNDSIVEDFIKLRRLNRRGVILLDSDRSKEDEELNSTKKRLIDEFSDGIGFAWVTEGREVENYLPIDQLNDSIIKVTPQATLRRSGSNKFGNLLNITGGKGTKTQASKVGVAHHQVGIYKPASLDQYDLGSQVQRLADFIKASNPQTIVSGR